MSEVHTSMSIGDESRDKLTRPFGWASDREAAMHDVRDWFYAEWLKLLAEKNARERAVERKFDFGKAA